MLSPKTPVSVKNLTQPMFWAPMFQVLDVL